MAYVTVGASLRAEQLKRIDQLTERLDLHRSQIFRRGVDLLLAQYGDILESRSAGASMAGANGREVSEDEA